VESVRRRWLAGHARVVSRASLVRSCDPVRCSACVLHVYVYCTPTLNAKPSTCARAKGPYSNTPLPLNIVAPFGIGTCSPVKAHTQTVSRGSQFYTFEKICHIPVFLHAWIAITRCIHTHIPFLQKLSCDERKCGFLKRQETRKIDIWDAVRGGESEQKRQIEKHHRVLQTS